MKPKEAQFQEVPAVAGLSQYTDLPSSVPRGRGTKISSTVKVRPQELGMTGLSKEEHNRASDVIVNAIDTGMAAKRGAAIVHNKNVVEHNKGNKAKVIKVKS